MTPEPAGRRFTFRFAQRVRVLSPHADAGSTGEVLNAYLFPNGLEIVFVAVPGGDGRYSASDLEALPQNDALPEAT